MENAPPELMHLKLRQSGPWWACGKIGVRKGDSACCQPVGESGQLGVKAAGAGLARGVAAIGLAQGQLFGLGQQAPGFQGTERVDLGICHDRHIYSTS